jgi:hypothetical protein
VTPTEYKAFCESTLKIPKGTDRRTYLDTRLHAAIGEVAGSIVLLMEAGLWTPELQGPYINRAKLLNALGNVLHYSALRTKTELMEHSKRVPNLVNLFIFFRVAEGTTYFSAASNLCREYGLAPEDVANANVAKLKDRVQRES